MIWRILNTLTRGWRKKHYIRNAIKKAEAKIWENEFVKHQLWEVRGGMREQYDWLRERVDGAIRRRAEIQYTIIYSESGDEVKVMDLPLPPNEIETLPDKATPPNRYHKVKRDKIDKKTVEELTRIIELRAPDLEQQKQQIQQIDAKVAEMDGSIAGLHQLKASLMSMLKKI